MAGTTAGGRRTSKGARRSSQFVTAGRSAAAGVAVLVAVACGGASGDENGSETELIDHEEVDLERAGTEGYRIRYRSQLHERESSALVFVPSGDAPTGGWPTVTWGHPSVGIADRCAPSEDPDGVLDGPLAELVDEGFAVVASDYEGLGTDGRHPYLVGESEAWSMLAAVTAADELPDVDIGGEVVAWGYSQGGHAALFAGEMAGEMLGDRDLVGVVAHAPVADVADFVGYSALSESHSVAALVAAGYAAEYDDLAVDDVLTGEGREALPVVDESCLGSLGSDLDDVDDGDFRSEPFTDVDAWDRRLQENQAGRSPSAAPVLVLHGTADPIVPARQSERYAARACETGSDVDLRLVEDADHATVLTTTRDDVLEWIGDRFDRGRAERGCEDR